MIFSANDDFSLLAMIDLPWDVVVVEFIFLFVVVVVESTTPSYTVLVSLFICFQG